MSERATDSPEEPRRFSILNGRRSAQQAAARVFDELVRERALGGNTTANTQPEPEPENDVDTDN